MALSVVASASVGLDFLFGRDFRFSSCKGHSQPQASSPDTTGRSEVLVWGQIRAGPNGRDYQCLVEPLSDSGAVMVARAVSTDVRLLAPGEVNVAVLSLYEEVAD
ncbi:UNVERIFIED_CONTAM: hypothetical protein FKN15_070389 [Acipenser sinensis]